MARLEILAQKEAVLKDKRSHHLKVEQQKGEAEDKRAAEDRARRVDARVGRIMAKSDEDLEALELREPFRSISVIPQKGDIFREKNAIPGAVKSRLNRGLLYGEDDDEIGDALPVPAPLSALNALVLPVNKGHSGSFSSIDAYLSTHFRLQ